MPWRLSEVSPWAQVRKLLWHSSLGAGLLGRRVCYFSTIFQLCKSILQNNLPIHTPTGCYFWVPFHQFFVLFSSVKFLHFWQFDEYELFFLFNMHFCACWSGCALFHVHWPFSFPLYRSNYLYHLSILLFGCLFLNDR